MNIKFKYEQDKIIFFTVYQGTIVQLLAAKLKTADFVEIKRLRHLALIELQSFSSAILAAKRAAI